MPQPSLKSLLITAMLLIVLAFGWRYRNAEAVQRIINPPSHKPLAIEFDNGTVRQTGAASVPGTGRAVQVLAPGVVRKCRRGTEITYTNQTCPPGHVEQRMAQGTVNVLPATAVAPRAPAGPAPAAGPDLRERQINRVLNP
ncbi:MAG: hypothetical protein A3E25_16015 [Burkholderiales bacterium RIFCSPHIGHO2_12_FULL_69_20]|nr:MAG: hypothetical protein A3E25_16015 [Burkholderiales bacterium RIFCSPHIGHO2_12_FULL_69_20]